MECVRFRHVVIGGGVVGLATAARLSLENRKFGEETSSRNSEVVHSGIYYPPATLKSRSCISGRQLLDRFCQRYNVPYKKVGKWVLACDEKDIGELERIRRNAHEVHVPCEFLASSQLCEEPGVKAVSALFVPDTGIIDSHCLMEVLAHLAEARNGNLALNTEVTAVQKIDYGYLVETRDMGDGQIFSITADSVVNAGGLWSSKIARMVMKEKFPEDYELDFCKGHYLQYSAPEPGLRGLGIHLTIDMEGMLRFGPDTLYVNSLDYSFSEDVAEQLKEKFIVAIQRYLPVIKKADLLPSYTGIRPKLVGSRNVAKDFIVQEESEKELPGFINMIGIESPGLTSSLALANEVAVQLGYQPNIKAWE